MRLPWIVRVPGTALALGWLTWLAYENGRADGARQQEAADSAFRDELADLLADTQLDSDLQATQPQPDPDLLRRLTGNDPADPDAGKGTE